MSAKRHSRSTSLTFGQALASGIAAACWCAAVQAGPAAKVYGPLVEYRETELEFRGGYVEDNDHPDDGEQQYVVAIGRGVMPRWFTEIVLEYERGPGESQTLEAVEWENIFQLTEPGQYFVDLGLFAEYVAERGSGKADKVEIGPLLQYELGAAQFNLNPIFEREVGDRASEKTELTYAAQFKLRGNPLFESGLQAFGELGEWDDWATSNQQEHNLGPAFFGKIKGGDYAVKYNAAWLLGMTAATPDNTLRFELELEY